MITNEEEKMPRGRKKKQDTKKLNITVMVLILCSVSYTALAADERDVIVVDPMLATGSTATSAIAKIKEHGVKNIKFMCIIASPEGLDKLMTAHPDIDVYCGCKDKGLNENKYIIPGLGDAGDRIFGTK